MASLLQWSPDEKVRDQAGVGVRDIKGGITLIHWHKTTSEGAALVPDDAIFEISGIRDNRTKRYIGTKNCTFLSFSNCFQLSVEKGLEWVLFCFTTLCDWLRNLGFAPYL